MRGDIRVSGIGVQGLAEHQHGLLVLLAGLGGEGNIGRDGDVAGDFLPYEKEAVGSTPDVLSAAGDFVAHGICVVLHRAFVQHGADVAAALENPRLGIRDHGQYERRCEGQGCIRHRIREDTRCRDKAQRRHKWQLHYRPIRMQAQPKHRVTPV
jgi:hypothetical protein